LRALAATLVVVGHILDDAPQFGVGALTALAELPVWQGGVDLFFVISGFIMMWTFGDRFGQPGSAREFLVRRVSRIVPLYWIATWATTALLAAAPSLFDRAEFQWRHLVLSMLFLPHYAPDGGLWPILGVGWTLNYEMFFYVMFALGLAFRPRVGIAMICGTMVGLFALASRLQPSDQPLVTFLADSVLLEFLFGVGIGLVVRRFGMARTILFGTAGVALAVALLAPPPVAALRAVTGGLPASAIVCLALATYPTTTGWLGRGTLALGAASYALYLGHTLVLNLTKGATKPLVALLDLGPSAGFVLYASAAFTLAIATALLLRRHVELPVLRWSRIALLRSVSPAAMGGSGPAA
jgi:exopolysaccharide production protein ExoZ